MAHRAAVRRASFPASLAALALIAFPAHALVVPVFFAGSTTIDRFTPTLNYQAEVPFPYYRAVTHLDIDVDHGVVDDGGLTSNFTLGDWNFDFDLWAPLMGRYDIQAGGLVTYGSPAPNVFAVTWDDVPSRNEVSVHNTFQVVFFGDSTYHTNNGITIPAGSVVFAYGSPTDPHGTVHYSPLNGAAIGTEEHGNVRTLFGLGIGDEFGVLSDLDIPALQNSGDPFLFGSESSGSPAPLPFDSVPELGGNTSVRGSSPSSVSFAASPNPVRRGTTFTYALPRAGHVGLAVYDLAGRRVATLVDRAESAGIHAVTWDARAEDGAVVPPGIYPARLTTADGLRTKRVVVVR